MQTESLKIRYDPEPTAAKFHRSGAGIRGIRGCFGSGKSTACVMEVLSRACEQKPFRGVRHTRWAIVRDTYPNLRDTTIKTWREWVPEEICHVSLAPPYHGIIKVSLKDGTEVAAEVIFLALDHPDDVTKLKSLELTGCWINEAADVPLSLVTVAYGRTSRYPSPAMGGVSWSGLFMDTNPPDDENWWYEMAEIKKPKNWEFFVQPGAILRVDSGNPDTPPVYVPNPRAENVKNHNKGYSYWLDQVYGSDEEWIKVYLMGQYGSVMSGKPVYPEYNDNVHLSKSEFEPYRGIPMILGLDFGLTPSCVFIQLTPRGQLRVQDELCSKDMGIDAFSSNIIIPHLRNFYGGMSFECCGDPAGNQRGQTDESTCLEILERNGLPTEMAPTNSFIARREAVARFLLRMVDGEPGLLIHPQCTMIRKGFNGGYRYRRLRIGGAETKYTESVEKNKFSHPHDALQYGVLHATEVSVAGPEVFGGGRPSLAIQPVNSSGWT